MQLWAMRRKVTHQWVGGTHTVCETCPACSYSIPATGGDEENPNLNAQTQRDSLSLQSQGEEFGLDKKRVPVFHFLYPPPPDSPGLFNIPQALSPGEASWSWATVGVHSPPGWAQQAEPRAYLATVASEAC